MAFLTRISTLRPIYRSKISPKGLITLSTSQVLKKTASEKVIDTVKGIDKAIAEKIVDGIEKGQKVAQKTKEMSGISKEEVKENFSKLGDKAKDGKEEVKENFSELGDKAKDGKEEIKEKTHHLKNKATDEKEEIKKNT